MILVAHSKFQHEEEWQGLGGSIPSCFTDILCHLHIYSLMQKHINKSLLICIRGDNIFFSPFDLLFPLEMFLRFPPSTFVPIELARLSMKASSICSPSMEFPRRGCCFLINQSTNHTKEDEK